MLSVIRKKIPMPWVRRRRPTFPTSSVSNHLLRDLGFDNTQIDDILGFIEGAKGRGARLRGMDAELASRAGTAANANDAPTEIEQAEKR